VSAIAASVDPPVCAPPALLAGTSRRLASMHASTVKLENFQWQWLQAAVKTAHQTRDHQLGEIAVNVIQAFPACRRPLRANNARQASTRWLLAAAPVQRVKQTRIQQMWAPLASKPACDARQIQEAPPGRALQPRVCAIPARRAPPVALAQSVKQGNTNLSLAALHVPSAGPIRTRRRLGPRHKKPARHVRRRRRAQQARAF
jgi:hypothetical protein